MGWRLKDKAKVIEIGEKFIIAPEDVKTDRIKITLAEGKSFGTGVHETTVSCIEVMETLDLKDKSVLDVGIGSGILSIAAMKLKAKRAVGFDIEKFAIDECKKNAKLNNVDIDCFVADSPAAVDEKFDLVIANIFDDIILSMKDEILRVLKKDGHLLLSGVLIEENFKVKRAFEESGLRVLKNIFLEEYTTILLKREEK
ncbi:50S ribosomal protein L11 methyltransferase [Hippea alviniae]|uniref:50S ribosomal protein L11 methyltransferase n=1 Tax=Hippea alviniae TaxID=1279027 RepID=UPI0003B60114|nr:50S ribosomal protein L11 methyltransferase [Hippea alviniae]